VVQSYSKHTCNAPSRDRTTLVWVIGIVFLVLGLIGFGLRVMARVFVVKQTWGSDDWVMLFAVVCICIAPYLFNAAAHHRIGPHDTAQRIVCAE
jgi:hypothetical protein